MSFQVVNKKFMLVGFKGSGEFVNFGNEIPLLAKLLLNRANEIPYSTETEVAFFEPKRDEKQTIGHYYVGLMVSEKISDVPNGMDYIETNQSYVTTRGNISNIGELHLNILNWAKEQGYQRDLEAYIVETYHPLGEGEEVEIYLPIQA